MVTAYRYWGYHPVHICDNFNNGDYKVIRKLGHDNFSTSWLADDFNFGRYVTLRIFKSDHADRKELKMIERMSAGNFRAANEAVLQILGSFRCQGPNGIHLGLIFEPLGPSVRVMELSFPRLAPGLHFMRDRLQVANRILQQTLKALAFLHSRGIAHGNLTPSNIVFALGNIDSESLPESALCQDLTHDITTDDDLSKYAHLTRTLDGSHDSRAPRYICPS
ncbi:kinase-like domain-containing protein [Podospora fimiseda]|uniref:non-specific serine/threonine protein kinase n=1 Tax=Podospora fimiseda TaxID=252190 RepID=A0AAN6YMI6_9PEZI|nr:kinase-like domain-containing protein [Podospora fimiseda]